MYYALDVRYGYSGAYARGCGRRPLGRRSFPNVGEKKSSRNAVFTTNKSPDWRSRARAYLQESIHESRGVGRGEYHPDPICQSRVVGRVMETTALVFGCAHPLEKSATVFTDANIHRLVLGW
jgi:hypothetical protein